MKQFLSPRQFADAIGVSESSVRRWADRGQIEMTRTAGGHRKIARTEAIRFIRERSATVLRPDLLEVSEPHHRSQRTRAFVAQQDEMLTALEQGKAEVASGLAIRMYLNGATAAEICDGPLRFAMQGIGEKWPSHKQSIFLEHRATCICIDTLNKLRTHFPSSSDNVSIAVGGAPEKDPYVLPSLMATTVLADVGYRPVNLGPNTPLDVLSKAALDIEAKLVWIAMTSPLPKANVEKSLSEAARRLGRKGVQVVIGGQATKRYAMPAGSHIHTCGSMSEMAGLAKGVLAALPKRPS